jgi:hypothetical protein
MPVNTFGSNLRVETNLNGQMVDNEELVSHQNNYKHTHHPDQPWQQGYKQEEESLKEVLMPPSSPVEVDESLTTANRNDLKIKGFNP